MINEKDLFVQIRISTDPVHYTFNTTQVTPPSMLVLSNVDRWLSQCVMHVTPGLSRQEFHGSLVTSENHK